jgi:pimeloyl-ACP methyl ester carboxylesterase
LTREAFAANAKAPIDCFYVYPTISTDPGGNSDMVAGAAERGVIRAQFARFASVCRPFAPLYRQVTLTALRAGTAGKPIPSDRVLAYTDVADAWRHYLQHDNGGRGVVLIGHSQGSGMLAQLIRDEIDGKPVQARIVSALLLGSNVAVPRGKDVGGAFKQMPLCRSAEQVGCVITYVSFRSTVPPPPDSRFGRVQGEGMEAGCTNPAALAGGKGPLHAYLSANASSIVSSSTEPIAWVTPTETISTPFVSVPGLLSAECMSNEKGSYLEVTVNGDPHDPRTDDIAGDVVVNGKVVPSWGLHLIDVSEAYGNLIDIVRSQTKTYLAKPSR